MDVKRTALLILDLQNDVIGPDGAFAGSGAPAHAEEQNVVANVSRLADAARKAGVPVIHVHHFNSVGASNDRDSKQNAGLWTGTREVNAMVPGSWGAEPVAGLEPQDGDIVIQKQRVSAFFATPLDVKLRGLGVDTVIVTGAWTNMSVESTIRYGADLGYEMVLASDGTSTVNAEWQKAAVEYAVTNLGEVKTTDELVAELGGVITRAALFRAPGRPFELADVDLQEPGPGDVLIRMAAIGVCGSDLHVVRGEWTRPVPMVLGHEGAGTVEAVGDDVRSVRVGDRVVVSWAPSCGACGPCRRGRPTACVPLRAGIAKGTLPDGTTRLRHAGETVYRMTAVGALARHVVVPERAALPLPDDVPLDDAALLGCAALTGVGAVLRAARLAPGATVAVVGAGGVGQFVVQGARIAGAELIVAIDPSAGRRAAALAVGATHAVAPDDAAAAVAELTEEGVDVAFEAVGTPATVALALALARPAGEAVLVGMPPAGARLDLDPTEFTNREKTMRGSVYGSWDPAEGLGVLVEHVRAGRLELAPLLGERFDLEHVDDAVATALAGTGGRVLVQP